ncbi:MAG: DoxX family protein [Proteobacteria bacterium]|nr:MAG: DoxX family protein [Pseudomonadota bacterium]
MSHSSNTKAQLWTGRVLSGLGIAFLLFDGVLKFFMDKLPPEALEAGAALQWPIEKMPLVGTLLLISLLLHVIPRTAIIGAVFLTGYLGGAIASHVRVGNPLLTHTLMPVYIAILIWLGLYLRDVRVRAMLAPRN